jgi:hypothetical protein
MYLVTSLRAPILLDSLMGRLALGELMQSLRTPKEACGRNGVHFGTLPSFK